MKIRFCAAILIGLLLSYCSSDDNKSKERETPIRVALETTAGKIVIELSDRTPLHRDNFLKLTADGAFDSLLFHRVIEGFVVQGGDPESKYAQPGDTLGWGGLEYKIPAEFDSTLFHKRGAVGAARNGNPERASSPIQFYIVQAKTPIVDSLFVRHEERINGWLQAHYFLNDPANQTWKDSLIAYQEAGKDRDRESYQAFMDTLRKADDNYDDFEKYTFPETHKNVYREFGGTPFLDQNYTVFGEVISGMEVVDAIASMATDSLDRPVQDIRIMKASVVEE